MSLPDLLYGGDGSDVLWGGAGVDSLYGEAGDDDLYGGLGSNTPKGGSGDDLLAGFEGKNTILSGSGDDQIQFNGGSSVSGLDTIQRFSRGHGTIGLSRQGFHLNSGKGEGFSVESEFAVVKGSAAGESGKRVRQNRLHLRNRSALLQRQQSCRWIWE